MKSQPRTKKFLSQNYLIDKKVLAEIISHCDLSESDIILEIGPGTGSLTKELVKHAGHIYAIETDKQHFHNLSAELPQNKVTLFHDDFLTFDIAKLPRITKIIGNIPYHISSPIINKLIENYTLIPQAFLTVQQEFGKRLAAAPNSKSYGSLTCFLKYHADTHILFPIKNTAFHPKPRVTSCFLSISFREPLIKAENEDLLFSIIRQAFQQRRRKIVNALHSFGDKKKLTELLSQLNINPHARAENLSLENFIEIYQDQCPACSLLSQPLNQ